MRAESESGRTPLLLHVFSTFAVGGAQMRFAALAGALVSLFRHVGIAMDGDYACASRLPPGLDVRCERIEAVKGATLANVRRFRRRLREIGPDVLVTYNWGAIEWAMADIPRLARHIQVEDGFGPEERTRQLPRRVMTRRLVLARSTVAVPSRTLWRIATEVWRLDPRRVRYVPNGIDFARFAGPHATVVEPVIGTVAGLRAEKNVARLVRTFRLVADALPARLVIAGDGPQRAELERLAGELGLAARVHFTGHLADPAALYRGLDVFALSSDTEQMPLSVIEAMVRSSRRWTMGRWQRRSWHWRGTGHCGTGWDRRIGRRRRRSSASRRWSRRGEGCSMVPDKAPFATHGYFRVSAEFTLHSGCRG
jgi:glycosyltransferase involved in cell wall biosynthesis